MNARNTTWIDLYLIFEAQDIQLEISSVWGLSTGHSIIGPCNNPNFPPNFRRLQATALSDRVYFSGIILDYRAKTDVLRAYLAYSPALTCAYLHLLAAIPGIGACVTPQTSI